MAAQEVGQAGGDDLGLAAGAGGEDVVVGQDRGLVFQFAGHGAEESGEGDGVQACHGGP